MIVSFNQSLVSCCCTIGYESLTSSTLSQVPTPGNTLQTQGSNIFNKTHCSFLKWVFSNSVHSKFNGAEFHIWNKLLLFSYINKSLENHLQNQLPFHQAKSVLVSFAHGGLIKSCLGLPWWSSGREPTCQGGLTPARGHVLQDSKAHAPQLLSLCSRTPKVLAPYSPCSATREATPRSPYTQTTESRGAAKGKTNNKIFKKELNLFGEFWVPKKFKLWSVFSDNTSWVNSVKRTTRWFTYIFCF